MNTTLEREASLVVEAQYDRVKGANWFPYLNKKDIIVIGQGGIGSWASVLLSRVGAQLYLFDMDSYESHNMTGQLVGASAIGMNKAKAAVNLIKELSPATGTPVGMDIPYNGMVNEVMICGLDNMKVRKQAFLTWKKYVASLEEDERKVCFFQDGRLIAEYMQVFNICGNDAAAIERYEKEYLFDDEEANSEECTFKQTSHAAAMIASHMVGFLTNWAANQVEGEVYRKVPFYFEYSIPLNRISDVAP